MSWTESPEGRAYILAIAEHVIAELGPEELTVLPEVADDFFAGHLQPGQTAREDALGFGLEGATVEAVSPAALAAASAVLTWLGSELLKTLQGEAVVVIKERVKALFTRSNAPAPTAGDQAGLSPAQLAQVREVAKKIGERYGMRPAKAEKLALSLVGALATQ
jgi:hypothetical protein